MSWFRTTKAKPAPVKAPVKGISKDKTRTITRRIEAPVAEKGKFYLKPLTCEQAWQFAERGGVYELAANGVDDETIARRSGLSLFDVRRAIAGPFYRQVDTQSDGRRTIALDGWNEGSIPDGSIEDPTPWENVYVSPADIARHTGLIHDPSKFILRWDHGGFTFYSAGKVLNPKVPEYGMLFANRTKSVKPQGDVYNQQVQKLKKRR